MIVSARSVASLLINGPFVIVRNVTTDALKLLVILSSVDEHIALFREIEIKLMSKHLYLHITLFHQHEP